MSQERELQKMLVSKNFENFCRAFSNFFPNPKQIFFESILRAESNETGFDLKNRDMTARQPSEAGT